MSASTEPSRSDAEILFWESIKDSTNPKRYIAYLAQYPDGVYAGLANVRVEELENAALPSRARPQISIEEIDFYMYGATSVVVRETPTQDSETVGSIEPNERIRVTGRVVDSNWLRVKPRTGEEGFVDRSTLTLHRDEAGQRSH